MAIGTDEDRDFSPETLREKERNPEDIDGGLPSEEKDAFDQIAEGFDSNEAPDADYSRDKKSDSKQAEDDAESDGFYRDEGRRKRRVRGLFNRKTAIGGGVAGLLIGGGFGLFVVQLGPMRFLNLDFALGRSSRLGGIATDIRLHGFTRTARLYKTGDIGETRVGYLGSRSFNRLMDRMEENHGVTFERREETGRPHDVRIEAKEGSPLYDSDPEKFRQNVIRELGLPDESRVHIVSRTEGRPVVRAFLRGENAQALNKVTDRIVKLDNEVANRTRGSTYVAMRKRVLRKFWRAPSLFNPINRLTSDLDESIRTRLEARRKNKTGKIAQIGEKYRAKVAQARSAVSTRRAVTASAALTFTGGLCMLKEISELLPAVNYAAFQVPSMEEAIDKQSVASAMRYGAFSSEELSWVYESLSDTNGNTVEGAAALNASSNGGPGYGAPADPALKQAFSMRGSNISDLVDIFLADLDANDRRALGVTDGAASIACSTPGLIVQAIAGAALLITGPGGIAAKGASLAQSMAVQTLLASLLGDLVQDRTQSLAREVCGINEEGRTVDAHKFGNCMAYGARGAHNLSALSAGGVDLSESQERTLAMRLDVQERSEFMQRSFFARIFDTAEPRSLAVSILGRMSRLDSVQGAAGLLSKITSIPTGLFSGAAAQLTPKALAQTDSYKWEFPLVSIPVEIFEDPKYEDPFENQKIVADILKDSSIRERAKTCWGVNITQGANGWQATAVEEVVQAENAYVDAKCSDFRYGESDEDEPWIRTSLFVFDDNIALTADCLDPEGDESSCTELGFSAQPHTTQPSSLNVPGLNGYVVPCTGQPTQIVRRNQGTNGPSAIWTNIQDSGTIGTNSAGEPIKVYIREACSAVNTKTIVIVSSIHGTENGGQFVAHDLLFNAQLPPNVRIVAIPELLPESSIAARNRRNANGVDLNRNFDYRWTQSSDSDETTPGARSYRGTAPASEPETAAIISFLQALGDVSLLLTYHDNLNYVAPVGLTPFPIANTYASATGMHGQCDQNPSDDNCAMKTVNQSGSLDGWYHHTTGHPTLLIELSSDESQAVISRHVEAVKAVVEGGHL